ncbi:tetratricopeptide repeat protein, partial [bacterium]|nr:tetratricopeptide repeat protein [bacterium]
INLNNSEECSKCGELLVREGGYLDAKGKAAECRLRLKKKDTMKTGWVIGGVFGGIGILIFVLYLKRELPIRNKNKAIDSAQSYFESKKYKKAINYYKKVQNYPISPRETVKIYLGLAQCYYKLEQYDDAIKHANHVLRNEERNEQARVVISKSFLGKKYVSDTALYEYKFLINLEPNNRELVELLCNYYMKKEIVNKDAVDIYKKMYKFEPQDKKIMDILGLAYMEEGRTDGEAQVMYEEILKFSPEKIDFRKMLIEIYHEKGLFNDVIKECKNIFKVDVDDKRIHNLFYEAFSASRKITEAILYYEQLSQNYPNKKNLKKILDKLSEKRHMNPELDENSSGISEQDRKKIKQAKTSGQTISICPSCAKLNPLGATSCTECGASLIIE